jgi:non-specific serine/threonine protein kinase
MQVLENHIREVPEDARARILVSSDYADERRTEDAMREANLAMLLRPNDANVLYNAACTFCKLGRKAEAVPRERRGTPGSPTPTGRRDPDLALHDVPEFDRLYPKGPG